MPLSDHEQRLLEQIEQALYDEDPKFARLYQATDVRTHYRARVLRAVFGVVLGLVAMLAGVVVPLIPLGIAGFLVMLASGMYLIHSLQRMTGRKVAAVPAPDEPRASRRSGRRVRVRGGDRRSLVKRLEERWQRRQEDR